MLHKVWFNKVLIANRGAIAVRIARTLRAMGVPSVGVFSPADRDSMHLLATDEAFPLGADRVEDSYLDQEKLFRIISDAGVDAVHPGYGFLSENADFAEALAARGITFIGPRPDHLRRFGLKHEARKLAESAGVNLLPGSGVLKDFDQASSAADTVGFPLMLKSSAGGGGIGMRCCHSSQELQDAFEPVQRLAMSNFGDASVFLEKYVANPRHVEVQVFGDGKGGVAAIGDRDCSLQRRHQKVIEECPAPGIPAEVRQRMHQQAVDLAASVSYENAGTVEFLYDSDAEDFFFLEVNTRLQVEHGVTEVTHNIDLVEAMVMQASGGLNSVADLGFDVQPNGHAIQARIYAEDPNHDFRPTPGDISLVQFPDADGLRVDTWIKSGTAVAPFYDPMLAKIITKQSSRSEAIAALSEHLASSVIHGIETNIGYVTQALDLPAFQQATMTTASLDGLQYAPQSMEIVEAGAATTIQSWPGRQGYWAVGVPPSGPMDDLSFRLGNRLLGNDSGAAGLEMVAKGPVIQFNSDATIVITGPGCEATLDDEPVSCFMPVAVTSGQKLVVGSINGGARAYLLVGGGLVIPEELGSTATFTLGTLGGMNGRALRAGDVIRLPVSNGQKAVQETPLAYAPDYASRDQVRIMLGPHTAPDFFTDEDIGTLLSATWTVHYNSSRTGVRLLGPQPQWTRPDGGEAGLHPSNIHDNAYAFGSIDFTGDMPVILGPDGPSLGGFVCPGVVINADRWKLGQLLPGDELKFIPVSEDNARLASEEQQAYVASLAGSLSGSTPAPVASPIILGSTQPTRPEEFTIRQSGQEWLLVEFGPPLLDIELHLKVHALARLVVDEKLPGIIEMTPGIRSLQIRFDTAHWSSTRLADVLGNVLPNIDDVSNSSVDSRIVHLPLSWDDPACREAISRYTQGVRPDAPWCPSNIEFIRRINGLESEQAVKDIVFNASYLVMGLGDVYLGAPVATPLDPRHRLVTTKYNPARTWTAENSVGIGGSYMCIYGMEGPGGYQFVGRTLQVWNRHKRGPTFDEHWLLRGFDQIRFYEVAADELLEMREAFPRGELDISIEPGTFDIAAYRGFLAKNADSIDTFTASRKSAFEAELAHWKAKGLLTFETDEQPIDASHVVEESEDAVTSPMTGSIWSIKVQPGQQVAEDELLVIVEAMKSEFEVRSPVAGTVEMVVAEGQLVNTGQALALVIPND
jgi:urea carboxylase